jgi:DNA-binding response OmpR family regulator
MLDIGRPDMDGKELARRLLAMRRAVTVRRTSHHCVYA